MFIATQFIIAEHWKQSEFPSTAKINGLIVSGQYKRILLNNKNE